MYAHAVRPDDPQSLRSLSHSILMQFTQQEPQAVYLDETKHEHVGLPHDGIGYAVNGIQFVLHRVPQKEAA